MGLVIHLIAFKEIENMWHEFELKLWKQIQDMYKVHDEKYCLTNFDPLK